MAIKIDQKHEKEIIALTQFESIRLRPGMYVGPISPVEERIPIIRDNKLLSVEKIWSPGFRHLVVEILENALDEAKRMKGKMKTIKVSVDIDTNEVIISDSGNGFHKAHSKHQKTKKNIVRTAMEDLHAGSNFSDSSTNIIGTHGVGSAVVNVLSSQFSVTTVNKTHYVHYKWEDYVIKKEEIRSKKSSDQNGTTVSFIPSEEVFAGYKWDKEILETYFKFKKFLISNDQNLKNLDFRWQFIENGQIIESDSSFNFLPEDHIFIKGKMGNIFLWESFEGSASISFINGSPCTGIHQRIVNDWCNTYFDYSLSHHFYNTLVSLDVPSTLMRFGDQNKSKYDITRYEIEDLMKESFESKLITKLKTSQISKNILDKIKDRLDEESMKKIKRAQKISRTKISHKYSPPSRIKDTIFITEGISAGGGVKQARDSEKEGVYSLKGKIKNTKRLSDLADNKEILEIISILGLEPGKENKPAYSNIVIAVDRDCISEDHEIITKRGKIKIKDLQYSDEILTHTGQFKQINRIIETYKDKLVEIEINGETFKFSENHLLPVFRDGEIKLIFSKNIKKTDFLLIKR